MIWPSQDLLSNSPLLDKACVENLEKISNHVCGFHRCKEEPKALIWGQDSLHSMETDRSDKTVQYLNRSEAQGLSSVLGCSNSYWSGKCSMLASCLFAQCISLWSRCHFCRFGLTLVAEVMWTLSLKDRLWTGSYQPQGVHIISAWPSALSVLFTSVKGSHTDD